MWLQCQVKVAWNTTVCEGDRNIIILALGIRSYFQIGHNVKHLWLEIPTFAKDVCICIGQGIYMGNINFLKLGKMEAKESRHKHLRVGSGYLPSSD